MPLAAFEIMRTPRFHVAERFEMSLLYHQHVTMLIQEEADFGCCRCVAEQNRIFDDL